MLLPTTSHYYVHATTNIDATITSATYIAASAIADAVAAVRYYSLTATTSYLGLPDICSL